MGAFNAANPNSLFAVLLEFTEQLFEEHAAKFVACSFLSAAGLGAARLKWFSKTHDYLSMRGWGL